MIRAAALMLGMALASCAPIEQPQIAFDEVEPKVRIVDEARKCIAGSQIRSSIARGNGVVDFTMVGGDVYRNSLKNACPGLRRDDAITYELRGHSLCENEIVYRLDTIGGQLARGASCSLGQFVPVEYGEPLGDAPYTMDE